MSFSGKVKEELSRQISTARHCQIAEIAAILSVCGQVSISANDHFCVTVHTENVSVARKYFTLVEKTFNIEAVIHVRKNVYLKKSNVYRVEVPSHEDTVRILQATKFMSPEQEIADDLSVMSRLVIQKECCKRAFLRGTFLAAGSISDPEKGYHLIFWFRLYRDEFCTVHHRMLQTECAFFRTYHHAGSTVITFSRKHHNRRFPFFRIWQNNIALADLCTGVAADTFFFIVDQWCGTARNHFNFHLTHLASPPI